MKLLIVTIFMIILTVAFCHMQSSCTKVEMIASNNKGEF
jgi:hypothetical protein